MYPLSFTLTLTWPTTIICLIVVSPEEQSYSREELKKWSSGNEVDDEILMRLIPAAARYFKDSVEKVTEADTDFFDAICEFNFGLLTDSSLVHSLMKFVHVWVRF